jgi:predicted RNA-binding Zn-ribbon protein involved in translation (DUF1610 family)
MARHKIHFNCPHCNALYHVVTVEAEPKTVDRQRACRSCGGPLRSREGKFAFQYHLLRERAGFDPRARRGQRVRGYPTS